MIGYRKWHYGFVVCLHYFSIQLIDEKSIEEALKAQRREQSRNPIWCSCSNWGWKASSSSFRFFVFCCFLLILPCTILNQVLYWYTTTTRRYVVVVNASKIEFFSVADKSLSSCSLHYFSGQIFRTRIELTLDSLMDSVSSMKKSSWSSRLKNPVLPPQWQRTQVYYQEEKNRRETNKEKRFRGQLK